MATILLDISRTVSRAPFPVPTGIDRVERAYIDHFLKKTEPVWFLTRIFQGYALLDRAGMQAIRPMLYGEEPWAGPDLIARLLSRKKHPALKRAESGIRRVARANVPRNGLGKMLGNHLPAGFTYLNVGHANRHAALWEALSKGGAGRKLAMIHDVIPLDYPQFTRPEVAQRFDEEFHLTAQACDTLIYNSADTGARSRFWLEKRGTTVDGVVALLGVDPMPEIKRTVADPPQFVILGTIEPRKNHALLLDIWADLPTESAPHLHIVGRRGWRNEVVFQRLDSDTCIGKTVFEYNDMDDTALSGLLSRTTALLFPSFAEGFGYPLAEALQAGIPVIASDLPCFREIAPDGPVYLDPTDRSAWRDAIRGGGPFSNKSAGLSPDLLGWDKHFHNIDKFL